MFNTEEIYDLDEFYKKYGGQRYRGILTPSRYPYIYLIHTKGKYKVDDLEVEGNNSIVHFAYESDGKEVGGNKAVIEHADRKGVYHSIFLFSTVDKNRIRYIGEYEYVGNIEKLENENEIKNVFVLKKVEKNIDEEPIYLVEDIIEIEGEERLAILTELGKRLDYFEINKKSRIITKKVATDVTVGSYLLCKDEVDSNDEIIFSLDKKFGKAIEVKDIRKKKVFQHIWILQIQSGFINRKKDPPALSFDINDKVVSYHINTGCGNATILVLQGTKNQVWCFDCGIEGSYTKDLKSNKLDYEKYKENIEDCLSHIKKQYFKDKKYSFSKLFISHPHSDHYNALLYELDDDYFKECELWINPYILTAGIEYIKFLKKIEKLVGNVVEPNMKNITIPGIEILYPSKSIVYGNKMKGKIKLKLPSDYDMRTSGSYNNLSPVIKLNINDKSMLITGDIEEEGWNEYSKQCERDCCKLDLNIFCHSHHGSPTGFSIYCPLKLSNTTVFDCFNASNFEVCMTRDGAYSGIAHSKIISNKSGKLLRTDESNSSIPIKFIEIDWGSMATTVYPLK